MARTTGARTRHPPHHTQRTVRAPAGPAMPPTSTEKGTTATAASGPAPLPWLTPAATRKAPGDERAASGLDRRPLPRRRGGAAEGEGGRPRAPARAGRPSPPAPDLRPHPG